MTAGEPAASAEQSLSERRFNTARPSDVHRPSPTHRYRFYTRALASRIEEMASELQVQPGARILDYGCAEQPYRHLFPADVDYVGADLEGNPQARVVLNEDGTLPLEAGDFDAVISTQVLEHVRDPALYLAECHRVLRPGGRLMLSTHGIFVYHPDPVDLWRWTCAGLESVIEGAGFEVKRTEGVVGLLPMGIQLVQDSIYWKLPPPLRGAFAALMQTAIGLADRLHGEAGRRMNASVFVVIAEKP